MRTSLALALVVPVLVLACGNEPPPNAPQNTGASETPATPTTAATPATPATPTTAATPATPATAATPATPTTAATLAAGMKDCTCEAAPTEACSPKCAPIKWQSADCSSPNGRPKACK